MGCSVHTVREEDMFCTHLWGMWDVLYIQLGKECAHSHGIGGRHAHIMVDRGALCFTL